VKTILHIIKKEFLQFKRDPKMFGVILIAPVIQLIFLGYAATLDVNIAHTLVYDQDQTIESRKFIESFTSSRFFKIDYYADDYNQLTKYLDKGNIILALVIPKDFSQKIQRNSTGNWIFCSD